MARARIREPVDTVTEIDTPERVRFACRLAGPAQRGGAYLVDLVLRAALLFGVVLLLGALGLGTRGGLFGLGVGLVLVAAFVVEWGYYVVSETFMNGQSLGKRAFALRVVRSDGLPISFGDSVLRNLLRAADFLPNLYGIGVVVMAVDPKFRRLGDLAAGTIVVCERGEAVLGAVSIEPPPTEAELRVLPARIPLSPDELEAVEAFVRRRSALHPLGHKNSRGGPWS